MAGATIRICLKCGANSLKPIRNQNTDLRTKSHDVRRKQRQGVCRIGFANPEREQLKAHLTLQIYRIIKSRGLTQVEAGAILGIKQPHFSGVMRNRSGNFSSND
jgi:predicted XRE-type DNA-binding protein